MGVKGLDWFVKRNCSYTSKNVTLNNDHSSSIHKPIIIIDANGFYHHLYREANLDRIHQGTPLILS